MLGLMGARSKLRGSRLPEDEERQAKNRTLNEVAHARKQKEEVRAMAARR
jgi:hypothetical protein